jgi:hypothetical protein
MFLDWLEWSNPVSWWWVSLALVSFLNLSLWLWTRRYLAGKGRERSDLGTSARAMIWLSLIYVLVCAFRSILLRADVQRICVFDTWLSSVLVGRFVATIAELCFVAQWAIVLNRVSRIAHAPISEKISLIIVPLIAVAECCSWYGVITTNYLGNAIEESIWTVTHALIAGCLAVLFPHFKGVLKYVIGFSVLGGICYVSFMSTVDVPMYLWRWRADMASGRTFFGFLEGLQDLRTRWIVTHDIAQWRDEIPWMSLYFSVAVWTSLGLCYVPLTKERLSRSLGK